jgi:hypothetical protein
MTPSVSWSAGVACLVVGAATLLALVVWLFTYPTREGPLEVMPRDQVEATWMSFPVIASATHAREETVQADIAGGATRRYTWDLGAFRVTVQKLFMKGLGVWGVFAPTAEKVHSCRPPTLLAEWESWKTPRDVNRVVLRQHPTKPEFVVTFEYRNTTPSGATTGVLGPFGLREDSPPPRPIASRAVSTFALATLLILLGAAFAVRHARLYCGPRGLARWRGGAIRPNGTVELDDGTVVGTAALDRREGPCCVPWEPGSVPLPRRVKTFVVFADDEHHAGAEFGAYRSDCDSVIAVIGSRASFVARGVDWVGGAAVMVLVQVLLSLLVVLFWWHAVGCA